MELVLPVYYTQKTAKLLKINIYRPNFTSFATATEVARFPHNRYGVI